MLGWNYHKSKGERNLRKLLFALTLTAGVLTGCSTGADETATVEENDADDLTQDEVSVDVSSADKEETANQDEETPNEESGNENLVEEMDSDKEAPSYESAYYQPNIPDENVTPEQWQDLNSMAYQLPEQERDILGFASLEGYLTSLKESWRPGSEFRLELDNGQFEEDSNLALSSNVYLNHFADEAANLGVENEIGALKQAAFNLHRNFYGTHQEKLNETLRQDFGQRLSHVTDLLELE